LELNSTFGDYISSGRNVRGITMRELSEELNLDPSAISKIEKGWRQFPKDKLKQLSEFYKVAYQEVLKEFIKSDLIQQYGGFPNYEKLLLEIITNEEKTTIGDFIKKGETKNIEFKSSLRFCLKTSKAEKYIEHSAIKNICAFLNSNGGKLIIGLADDGEILGLENTDFKTFKDADKKDAFLKHLDNLISKYFGNDLSLNLAVEFEQIESKIVCEIDVLPNNNGPIFLKNPEKNNSEEFYIRRNASAITLNMDEFYKYSKERW
jgi:transcriptional regulator with XRE-family HTH domain